MNELTWRPENIAMSDAPPASYVAFVGERFDSADWDRMMDLHALPEGWEDMEYGESPEERRRLMEAVIRRGFETLA